MSETDSGARAGGNRRIDRVLAPGFADDLSGLSMEDLRERRDVTLAEREYLSLVRRLLHGRRDILKAELDRRRGGESGATLVERLPDILSDDPGPSRGEAPLITLPEEELTLARRRVERLLADVSLSDLENLTEQEIEAGLARLDQEETRVSEDRAKVMAIQDALQEEFKGRYRAQVQHLEG